MPAASTNETKSEHNKVGKSKYIRRAMAELTGQTPKSSPQFSVGQSIALAVVVAVFALGFVGWILGQGETSVTGVDSNCAFRVAEADAPVPVTEGDATNINTCVQLERVNSGSKLQLGLSNRRSMAWDRGMLFDFGEPSQYCMWMKDMHFSLDMLWVNEQYEVVATRENIAPETFPDSFCGPNSARYVVEVNAGVVRAADLRLGQHLNLQAAD